MILFMSKHNVTHKKKSFDGIIVIKQKSGELFFGCCWIFSSQSSEDRSSLWPLVFVPRFSRIIYSAYKYEYCFLFLRAVLIICLEPIELLVLVIWELRNIYSTTIDTCQIQLLDDHSICVVNSIFFWFFFFGVVIDLPYLHSKRIDLLSFFGGAPVIKTLLNMISFFNNSKNVLVIA